MLLSEFSYTMYITFMAILFSTAAQLIMNNDFRNQGSLKVLRLAVVVFVVNFAAAWWALQQTVHRPVVHTHGDYMAFLVIFYITMILGTGLLLHILVLLPVLGWFRSVDDSTEPVASISRNATGNNHTENESLAARQEHRNTDIENNCSTTMRSIEPQEIRPTTDDDETELVAPP